MKNIPPFAIYYISENEDYPEMQNIYVFQGCAQSITEASKWIVDSGKNPDMFEVQDGHGNIIAIKELK
jgi:hypothetical protein